MNTPLVRTGQGTSQRDHNPTTSYTLASFLADVAIFASFFAALLYLL